jgi:hypothetical protein
MLAHTAGPGGFERLAQVQGNLVAEEIEVDPGVGAAAFGAAEHATVKTPRGVQIGDVKREVK